MRLVLADLGIGNLHSLTKALQRHGARVEVSAEPKDWLAAHGLVLPGVGSFGAGLRSLRDAAPAIRARLEDGVPCLGVCLGMQLLYEASAEDDGQGIGFLPGRVERFPPGRLKVPHMGWTPVESDDELFQGVPPGTHFYFVHSYYAAPDEATVATSEHGIRFSAAARRGNTIATQFHPEKSGEPGLRLLANAMRLMEASA